MAGKIMERKSSSKEVQFNLFAPGAKSVSVAGSFNNWNQSQYKLTKDSRGNWSGSVPLKSGRYEYRFVVDGQWSDDPQAKATSGNAFGTKNAIINVK